MAEKSFFVDTTRCTACRGCQIACKQWNKLPATKTYNWGSYQNPADLSFNTFKLVRFSEVVSGGKMHWYFFTDQCRHCLEPPCKDTADGYVDGAVVIDGASGAVIYTDKSKKLSAAAFEEVKNSCPYNIPRRDVVTGLMAKCTMCIDRVANGLLPACVKACPTGAMNFGARDDMLALANKRLAALKDKGFSKAQLLDADSVRTIYLVVDDPMVYHKFAVAQNNVGISRKLALRKLFGPAAGLLAGAAMLGKVADVSQSE
ncbi:MAG: formate dehydrogenase [Deltaproteobacteria bacterium]|nr:formate dehydrogenase [Deltaproteobacteria bacterium]MBW2071896.1 formate dehydrogenase [Deltaproteobacteria bacterium]